MRFVLSVLAGAAIFYVGAGTAKSATIETISFTSNVYQGGTLFYPNGFSGTMTILMPGDQLLENGNTVLSYDFTVEVFSGIYDFVGTQTSFTDVEIGPVEDPTVSTYFDGTYAVPRLGMNYSDPFWNPGYNWWFGFDGPYGDSAESWSVNAVVLNSETVPEPSTMSLSLLILSALIVVSIPKVRFSRRSTRLVWCGRACKFTGADSPKTR